jgi:predicted phosphodiesterase
MKRLVYCVLPLLMMVSCKQQFMFHPNEVRPDEEALNSRNIEKISTLTPKPAFNFILLGDTQRFYEDLEDFVNHVNSMDSVSFVLLAGDLVDFGLNKEYNWIASRLGKLSIPYVAVIGNHDMVANGRTIFGEMFGPENFSFSYGKNKFICLNSNSREVDYNGQVPDINWLTQQLNDNEPDNIFVLSHVPPFSADFDKTLEPAFTGILAAQPKTRISLHGHDHNFKLLHPYPGGLPYLTAASTGKRSYAMIAVNGELVSVTEKHY